MAPENWLISSAAASADPICFARKSTKPSPLSAMLAKFSCGTMTDTCGLPPIVVAHNHERSSLAQPWLMAIWLILSAGRMELRAPVRALHENSVTAKYLYGPPSAFQWLLAQSISSK